MKKLLVMPIMVAYIIFASVLLPVMLALEFARQFTNYASDFFETIGYYYEEYLIKPNKKIYNYALTIMKSDKTFEDQIDLLTSELAKSPWISVEERLPEENGRFYVIAAGEPDMAFFRLGKTAHMWVTAYREQMYKGTFTYKTEKGDITKDEYEYRHLDLTKEVTHWMPIPKLTTK